jgi:hypothetical protein
MAKYRSGEVRIEVSDVLDQIDDEDLIEEVRDRKLMIGGNVYEPIPEDEIKDAYRELVVGRHAEARAILERLIKPKWGSIRGCEVEYAQAKIKPLVSQECADDRK